jgi:hypothetical protein
VIERAIENWLTRTNERNYQAAFCQVLMHQGHRVLYSSSHGPMEQGKDIITIGPDGECHAYQTKTGDIGLSEWRNIAGEIQELVELPVDYPGVDKSRPHAAYLVTNGTIKDPVRIQINDRNEDNQRKNRQYAHLEVIGKDSLLKSFVDAQGRFVPRELPDMRAFLELYLEDGRGMLPKEKLFAVLEGTTFGQSPERKSDAIDAITSSHYRKLPVEFIRRVGKLLRHGGGLVDPSFVHCPLRDEAFDTGRPMAGLAGSCHGRD